MRRGKPREAPPRVAIIGAGMSGLCLGMQLKRAGNHNFTIFEKSDALGGTWRDNIYPGAACDVPAFSYCFSFEQKTDWSAKWAPQPEILAYLEHCAQKYQIGPHFRFGVEIAAARFDEQSGVWRLRSSGGESFEAEVLVSGVGQLNRPALPEIPGLRHFAGQSFHSARWPRDCDLSGQRVAVIGNAASAVQFTPHVARQAAQLHIFQRSANWIMPQQNRQFSAAEKRRFARSKLRTRLYRWWTWASFEMRWPMFRGNRWLSRLVRSAALGHLRNQVRDPALRKHLVPDYPIGGKRMLILDDYYPILSRDNVELVTQPIERITSDSVVTRDGRARPVDVLILATGFRTTEFLTPMRIEGLSGRTLQNEWREGAQGYLGICVAGFPNFFMMYGPNTNLGHNSIIFMIECQTRYIMGCLRALQKRGLKYLNLRREVMEDFNQRLQSELQRTIWAAPERSWYKDDKGRITNNWSGSTARYWWRTRRARLGAFHAEPLAGAGRGAAAARDASG